MFSPDSFLMWWAEFLKDFFSLFLDSMNKFSNLILAILTLFILGASKRSSMAAEKSAKAAEESARATKDIADDTKKSRRPYLVFCKERDFRDREYCYVDGGDRIIFPYALKNTGQAAAIEVRRNHYVIREREEAGKKIYELVEKCLLVDNNFECSIVPDEISAVHVDHVYLRASKDKVGKFRIIYHMEYKSDIPSDNRCFEKVVTFELLPIPGASFIDRRENRYALDATRLIMPTIEEKRPSEERRVLDINDKFEGLIDCSNE